MTATTTWADRERYVTNDPQARENQRRFRSIARMACGIDDDDAPGVTPLYQGQSMAPYPFAKRIGEVRANLLLNALTGDLPNPGSSNWKEHGPGEVPDPDLGLPALEDLAFAKPPEDSPFQITSDFSHWREHYDDLGEYPNLMALITLSEAIRGGRDGVTFDLYEIAVLRWQHRRALNDDSASFQWNLWDAIVAADEGNLERLAVGFPLEVEAYRRWTHDGSFARRLRSLPINFSI